MAQVEIRTQKTLWVECLALGRLKFVLRRQSLPIDGYENQTGSPVGVTSGAYWELSPIDPDIGPP